MNCKLLTNGIAIGYDKVVKPCCVFKTSESWKKINHINNVNLATWHQTDQLNNLTTNLNNNIWPNECSVCQVIENMNRGDSVRLNAENSYSNYSSTDITLEIRPGSVCNFACQTCWPLASSRVREFYKKANLLEIKTEDKKNKFTNFNFLLPIRARLKNIIILGGEPFYDKDCLRLLSWLSNNDFLSDIIIFTNGSNIDFNFIKNYKGKLTLVFSLDAIGKPAEYIRYGTSWDIVLKNFNDCKNFKNINLRVNITTSPYNYFYLKDLIEFLVQDWPEVVSFGVASTSNNSLFMDETVIPMENRKKIVDSLNDTKSILMYADIEYYQKINAINAVESIINNLINFNWNESKFTQFKNFVKSMDSVKNISCLDYCPEVADFIDL